MDMTKLTDALAKVPETKPQTRSLDVDPEVAEILDGFEAWLTADGGAKGPRKESTAKAYKYYVVKGLSALNAGTDWKDLDTDVRSGLNAFIDFRAAQLEAAGEEADEDAGA